jgi:hypothetical protein
VRDVPGSTATKPNHLTGQSPRYFSNPIIV